MQSILMNHDAGKYWSKNSLIIKPGVISIETLSLNIQVIWMKLNKEL